MPSLSTLPKGDSAWLLRKSIERIMQQVSVLETNIGSSTTGNSSNGQVIFNDNGTLRGDADMTFNTALNKFIVSSLEVSTTATISGDLTVDTSTLKVDSANNRVGIGTASPNASFEVKNAGAQQRWDSGGATDARVELWANSLRQGLIGWNTNSIVFGGDSARNTVMTWQDIGGVAGTAMTLNSTGLGVGGSPSGNVPMVLVEGIAGSFPQFTSKVGAKSWSSGYRSGTLQYEIWEDSTTRFVIANGGNVGIGVTPSAAVAGNRKIEIGGNTNAGLTLSSSSANASARNWSTLCNFNAFGDLCFNQSNAQGGDPIAAGTTRMTLDASGRLLVGPTSANTSGGVLQLSSGITFPATQVASSDANTLDDYEEGTFTPTIVGTTAAGVGTYTTQVGRYTKVGDLVTIQIYLDWTAHTGTGNMNIGALPFGFVNAAGVHSGASFGYVNGIAMTAGNILTGYGAPANNFITLNQTPTGGGASNTVPIDGAGSIIVTMTYKT